MKMKQTKNVARPSGLLTEIEAALEVGMSPTLLRWLTKNPPKAKSDRTLPCHVEDGEYFYARQALREFDAFLAEAWPHKPGKRPHVPAGIREEIKLEAYCECAVCHNMNDGEAAHIVPVAGTLCNHPKNLIWMCPSHHTGYDFGHRVHATLNRSTVKVIKERLTQLSARIWRIEHRAEGAVLSLVKEIEATRSRLAKARDSIGKAALVTHGAHVLSELQKAAKGGGARPSSRGSKLKGLDDFVESVGRAASRKTSAEGSVLTAMSEISTAKEKFLAQGSLVECPACHGNGAYGRYDTCQVCDGEGVMEAADASEIDPADFREVGCPLCKGKGSFGRYDECPVCLGDGSIENRLLEDFDRSDFEDIECPKCKGSGHDRSDRDCPICGGDGTVEKRALEDLDLAEYDDDQCPLCKGSGHFRDYDACPVCGGDGSLERRHAHDVDLSDFDLVKCPRCKGRGDNGDHTCRHCDGSGTVERRSLQDHD